MSWKTDSDNLNKAWADFKKEVLLSFEPILKPICDYLAKLLK